MENQLSAFEGKSIRSIEHEGEMWFAIVDIIEVLTESKQPSVYWANIKRREPQLLSIRKQLKMQAADGKNYKTDCANTEGVLRLIQSVASPKAEPFKLWLAGLGKQAIEEAAEPELGFDRLTEIYKAKGYSDEWIAYRLKTIGVRKQLTEEWKARGVAEGQEYSILTATIAKGTFGLTPSEHGALKGLEKQNLRDHMTNLELIFTALSEETTRQFAVNADAQGFNDNHDMAEKGGRATGQARQNYEKTTGLKVVSSDNFLKSSDDTEGVGNLPKESKTDE